MGKQNQKSHPGARVVFLGLVTTVVSAAIYTTNNSNRVEFYFNIAAMVFGVVLALTGTFVYPGRLLFKFVKALLIVGLAVILSVAAFDIAFSKFYNF